MQSDSHMPSLLFKHQATFGFLLNQVNLEILCESMLQRQDTHISEDQRLWRGEWRLSQLQQTASGISASVKRAAQVQMLTGGRAVGVCVGLCWVKLDPELSGTRLVPAPSSLYRWFANFGETKEKGHILSPPASTEAGHGIKKLLTLCFCTDYFNWGKTGVGVLKIRAPWEHQQSQNEEEAKERRQQRSWLATRENPRDQTREVQRDESQEPWPVISKTGNFKERHSTDQCNFLPNLAVLSLLGREEPLNVALAAEQVRDIPNGTNVIKASLLLALQ